MSSPIVETALVTTQGKTSIADVVVEKIAGMATREISGVYKLGGGAARAFGAIRERIPGQAESLSQGVSVEVGERQAAVDLDITVEYGVEIGELTKAIRRNVISAIERMTTLQVTEVNIVVHDVHIPSDDDDDQPGRRPRRVVRVPHPTSSMTPDPKGKTVLARLDPTDGGVTDADMIRAITLGSPDVAAMSEATRTYLPGRTVSGVRVDTSTVDVHVIARYGTPLPELTAPSRCAAPAGDGGPRLQLHFDDLHIEDIELPRRAGGRTGAADGERAVPRARRTYIRQHHPDRGGDPAAFIEGLQRLDQHSAKITQPATAESPVLAHRSRRTAPARWVRRLRSAVELRQKRNSAVDSVRSHCPQVLSTIHILHIRQTRSSS